MSSKWGLITEVKQYLHSLFTIKDLGIAKYLLGVEVLQKEDGMFLSQSKYINDILKD